MKKIFLITIFAINTLSLQGIATRLQASLLGNEDASPELVKICNDACKAHGIAPCQVKYLNPIIGKSLIKRMVTSCPGLGNIVWFDKDAYVDASEEDQRFAGYHETAHLKEKHPLKNCLLYSLTTLMVGVETYCVSKIFPKWAMPLIVSADVVIGGVLLTRFTQYTEKRADIIAAAALIRDGRNDVVQAHLEQLKDAYEKQGDATSIIYPSLEKQMQSLKPFVG